MIVVGIFLAGLLLVLSAGRALDTPDESNERSSQGSAFGVLLFALCLLSVLTRRKRDEDDC